LSDVHFGRHDMECEQLIANIRKYQEREQISSNEMRIADVRPLSSR